MGQEVRPAAWVEDLNTSSAQEVKRVLLDAKLGSSWNGFGLEVEAMQGEGHVAAHHLAVVMSELGETFEEVDYEETMEKAEIALREAGFALIFVKRQTADGWAAPLIQIYGKSAEGPGPRTVRQTVRMTEKEVLDLS